MVSEKDNTNSDPDDGARDGYAIDDYKSSQVPLKGHMVTYRFCETVSGAEEVGYREMVEEAKDRGLGRQYVPEPRYGHNAFRKTLMSLSARAIKVHSNEWDSDVCTESWKAIHMKDGVYSLVRKRRGKRDGVEHMEQENMYRISYDAPKGDVITRTWHDALVKDAWGEELGEDEKKALAEHDFTQYLNLRAYQGGSPHSVGYFTTAREILEQRFQSLSTRVDGRMLRRSVNNNLRKMKAIPWGSSSGAVYVIPDLTGEKSYLTELESWAGLIEWFSQTVTATPMQTPVLGGETENTEHWVESAGTKSTNIRILGYIDSKKQIEYLRRDMAAQINETLRDYVKDYEQFLSNVDVEKEKQFNRAVGAWEQRKTEVKEMLETHTGGFIDGIQIEDVLEERVQTLHTRISSIAPPGLGNTHNLLVGLLNFSEDDGILDEE